MEGKKERRLVKGGGVKARIKRTAELKALANDTKIKIFCSNGKG